MARISDADKDAIRNAYALGRANMVVLAQQWQCSKSYIHRIIHSENEAAKVRGENLIQQTCGFQGTAEYPDAIAAYTKQGASPDGVNRRQVVEGFNPFIGWWYPHRGYRDRVYMTKPQRRYAED